MNRWAKVSICAGAGLLLLACGLLLPAYVRAVDERLIARAGRNTPTLVEQGLALVKEKKPGAARMLLQAAQQAKVPGYGTLNDALNTLARQNPGLETWGVTAPDLAGPADTNSPAAGSEPITEFVIHLANRDRVLDRLAASTRPVVQEVLRFRAVTNTVEFPPSSSASGQALDAALAICGLLLDEEELTAGMSNDVFAAASAANHGNSQSFEEMLVDLMSLGQKLNWGQLVSFVGRIDGAATLHQLADQSRKAGRQMPLVFAAVQLSGDPAAVARYLENFSQSGFNDLGASLRYGAGGVNELLQRDQPLNAESSRPRLFVDLSLHLPRFALTVKWFLYLASGFLLALAMHFARPPVAVLERPLQVRGFHMAREFLFGLGFLLVVLLLSEPFLARDSQKAEFRFQVRLPTVGSTLPAGKSADSASFMNQANMLTMLLFFALQALLYSACLVKLAEIRRQRVPQRMKLKLLENEEHLFDAGLYLGFLGTIISFVLYSLKQGQHFSLMVAYSSTSFGIIFVSFFKIFHLRPARRKLLLEADAGSPEPDSPPVPTTSPAGL